MPNLAEKARLAREAEERERGDFSSLEDADTEKGYDLVMQCRISGERMSGPTAEANALLWPAAEQGSARALAAIYYVNHPFQTGLGTIPGRTAEENRRKVFQIVVRRFSRYIGSMPLPIVYLLEQVFCEYGAMDILLGGEPISDAIEEICAAEGEHHPYLLFQLGYYYGNGTIAHNVDYKKSHKYYERFVEITKTNRKGEVGINAVMSEFCKEKEIDDYDIKRAVQALGLPVF